LDVGLWTMGKVSACGRARGREEGETEPSVRRLKECD
jgi:hypothetical protein